MRFPVIQHVLFDDIFGRLERLERLVDAERCCNRQLLKLPKCENEIDSPPRRCRFKNLLRPSGYDFELRKPLNYGPCTVLKSRARKGQMAMLAGGD
jgi:hypothetical protein